MRLFSDLDAVFSIAPMMVERPMSCPRTPKSPWEGECSVGRTSGNATTGCGGRTDSEAGQRSDADELPGPSENISPAPGCEGVVGSTNN